MTIEQPNKKRGPKPKTVKIDGDWQEAMKKALSKPRPKEGWPDKKKKS